VFICCDCTAAIDIVVLRSDPHKRPNLFRRILELEKVLHDYGLGVKILWELPGHAGVEGNKKADRLAKLTARTCMTVSNVDTTSCQLVVQYSCRKSWQ